MKKTSRAKGSRTIRQNRPQWRKKVIGHKPNPRSPYFKDIKIKGKEWERVKKK